MISLSTVEAKLPPGFRFHPKDEELICNYLMKWVTGCAQQTPLLIEVDLNKCEPWDIPETACVGGREWYFYSQRDRKYATGIRTNRATVSGYWKATGKDRPVMRKGTTLVGMRKTLVFYQGRAPKGRKTDWVMHEFRLEGTLGPVPKQVSSVKEDWVLCRMFYKNRSEELGKQETGNISSHDYEEITASSSSLSLPPLMEPYNNNISFHQQQIITDQATASDYNYQHHQQVPCFSNIYNQTAPNNFSHISPTHNQESMVWPTKMMMPNLIGQTTFPYLGINFNSQSSLDDTNPSSCDKKVIETVLNHLTKIESADDHHDENKFTTMKDSPASFGEGSSDSYLSEGGLIPSMWSRTSDGFF